MRIDVLCAFIGSRERIEILQLKVAVIYFRSVLRQNHAGTAIVPNKVSIIGISWTGITKIFAHQGNKPNQRNHYKTSVKKCQKFAPIKRIAHLIHSVIILFHRKFNCRKQKYDPARGCLGTDVPEFKEYFALFTETIVSGSANRYTSTAIEHLSYTN